MSATHHLIITGAHNPADDIDEREYEIECSDPSQCNGWMECDEKTCRAGDPEDYLDEDEVEIHGLAHTYVYGYGWAVILDGCPLVTFRDSWIDSAVDLDLAPGRHEVDDDWGDDVCYLATVEATS